MVAAQAPQAQAPQQAVAPAAPEHPRGMVGRAMQYVSERIQQLSNYFESKLPQHTLNEVKEIGLTMSRSGVKEVSIPAGPEMQQQRGGPEQQRGQQQGLQRS
jgi:hypothetical protein